MVEQGRSVVIGALGVLKAGGVVVAVEKGEGEGRGERILEEAGVGVVVTEEKVRGKWREEEKKRRRMVVLDGEEAKWKEEKEERWEGEEGEGDGRVEAGEVACVLYRSSAEGKVEGIGIVHGQLRGDMFGGVE